MNSTDVSKAPYETYLPLEKGLKKTSYDLGTKAEKKKMPRTTALVVAVAVLVCVALLVVAVVVIILTVSPAKPKPKKSSSSSLPTLHLTDLDQVDQDEIKVEDQEERQVHFKDINQSTSQQETYPKQENPSQKTYQEQYDEQPEEYHAPRISAKGEDDDVFTAFKKMEEKTDRVLTHDRRPSRLDWREPEDNFESENSPPKTKSFRAMNYD